MSGAVLWDSGSYDIIGSMKRAYELMVVLTPDGGWDDVKTQKSFLEKLLSGTGAVIGEVTPLGKKQLAYPIKKQIEGFYLLAKLEGVIKAGDLEKQTRLTPGVLRYLLTVQE